MATGSGLRGSSSEQHADSKPWPDGTDQSGANGSDQSVEPRASRGLLALLTAAAFLIFAQAFMIAPILPRLAQVFHAGTGIVGLAVPAYLVPYG